MKLMKNTILPLALTCHALAGTAVTEPVEPQPGPKLAQSSSAWWFKITPYAWVTATDGDMGVAGLSAPVDISFKDTLDDLDLAFMLAFEGGFDRWAFGFDGIYAASSSGAALPAAAAPYTKANLDIDQFFGRVHAGYQLIADDDAMLTAFVGARFSHVSADLAITGGAPTLDADGSKSWVDPVIGLHGLWNINDRWFIQGGGDIGGFGVSSDLIWQANAAFGYRINPDLSLLAGYRGFGVDYSNDGFLIDTVAHGPAIGLSFRF